MNLRRRLDGIDPILSPLNDDGSPSLTIVIHGAGSDDLFLTRPETDSYETWISEAQIPGAVYLLSWRSGFDSWNPVAKIRNFYEVEHNAHRLGNSLASLVANLQNFHDSKLTLIGHSLGAHAITSALLASDWRHLRLRDVILLGAAIGEEDYEGYTAQQFWKRCVSQVSGHIVNCYSRCDKLLWYRKALRGDQLECIGRARTTHDSPRLRNITFTGTLSSCEHDYLWHFDRVMNRVYPRRKRSADYPVVVWCDCPWCEETVFVEANKDVECPVCGITFEFRTVAQEAYWRYEPIKVECPNCELNNIVVQAPGVERCGRCRRDTEFYRRGSRITY